MGVSGEQCENMRFFLFLLILPKSFPNGVCSCTADHGKPAPLCHPALLQLRWPNGHEPLSHLLFTSSLFRFSLSLLPAGGCQGASPEPVAWIRGGACGAVVAVAAMPPLAPRLGQPWTRIWAPPCESSPAPLVTALTRKSSKAQSYQFSPPYVLIKKFIVHFILGLFAIN